MRAFLGVHVQLHSLTSALNEVVSFTPRPPYPKGQNHRYPLNRRLGESKGRSGRFGEDTNVLLLGRPARSLVTIRTEVSRFGIVRFTTVTASVIFEYHIRINEHAIRMSVAYP
jgi:hypothetical protein